MQSLDGDEKYKLLGGVSADELKVIHEYVSDIPTMKQQLHKMQVTLDEHSDQLAVIEHVAKGQETDLRNLKRKIA